MNYRIVILLALILFTIRTTAQKTQENEHTLKVLSHVTTQGVKLRWAPSDFTVWQLGNKYGYSVERYTLKPDGTLLSSTPVTLRTNLKPFPKSTFENLSQTAEEAAILQELIYTNEPASGKESDHPGAILSKRDDLNNRFGMALLVCDLYPSLAAAAGLFHEDTTAVKKARYIYKVSLANQPTKIEVEPGVIVVDVVEAKPLHPFTDLKATFGDRTVTLSWPTVTHRGIYSAYHIERYDDIQKKFVSITGLPYVPMADAGMPEEGHFVDSLDNNTTTFQYRVKGITPFGEEGPPSNIVKGEGKDNLSGLVVLRAAALANKNVALVWEFPAAYESKIAGFLVCKARSAEGTFQPAQEKPLPPNSREFQDTPPSSSAYYQVKAIDKQGRELTHSLPFYLHIEDNTPPASPSGLSGKIDSTGIATITWSAVVDASLLGYRVFSSHHPGHEFVEITREIVTAPVFTDTLSLRTLNNRIFYKVVAVDQNYNTSGYSPQLALARPDVIAPAAPLFTKVEMKGKEIVLEWINSPSQDVTRYELYRKGKGDPASVNVITWPAASSKVSHVDAALLESESYQYFLHAYDSTGNKSIATSKEVSFEPGVREAISDLTAIIDREKKSISLHWKSRYAGTVKKYFLYRKMNNGSFTLYQILPGTTDQFSDENVLVNNTYSYKIQLILSNNIRSELSKELRINF